MLCSLHPLTHIRVFFPNRQVLFLRYFAKNNFFAMFFYMCLIFLISFLAEEKTHEKKTVKKMKKGLAFIHNFL